LVTAKSSLDIIILKNFASFTSISHPHIRVKHCTYGHSVVRLLNPQGVTTVYHKYSLTVARHATVVVAVRSTIHYKIKIYYLR
jgi:hypothetical protein